MDPEEFRAILSRSRAGIWSLIETAIRVASSDYGDELRRRRDKIVESLYAPPSQLCDSCNGNGNASASANQDVDVVQDEPYYPQNVDNNSNFNYSDNIDNDNHGNCNSNNNTKKKKLNSNSNIRNSNENFSQSPLTPESNHRNFGAGEEEEDPYGGLFDDDEQTKIITIKEQLEDPDQSEDAVVELLQNLADMDITFQALKETDIGRHVNRLRKYPSNEVRGLVKQLVRKWKETVDDWVKVNQPQAASNLIADGDSPHQSIPKNQQNGHHQVPDFGYSPNPYNGSSSVERNYGEYDTKPTKPTNPKPSQTAARREAPSRPQQPIPKSASAPPNRAQRDLVVDDERLNSARRRLQENYLEAENAKRQRTVQVMDIKEIPRPKNGFFAKNKGGSQGRHHR
ncbi:hypothetical protein ABFX02_12G003800 [Erythranthe guttata]